MKVLFITHYVTMYGGNRSLIDMLDGLKGYDIDPIVVVPCYGPICKALEEKDIPIIIQKFRNWNYTSSSIKGRFKNLRSMYHLLRLKWKVITENSANLENLYNQTKHLKIDIVYSNSSVFNFGFNFSRKYDIPHIWHFREVQEHYNFNWIFNNLYVNWCFRKSEMVIAISSYVKKNYQIKNRVDNIIVEYDGVLSHRKLQRINFTLDQVKDKRTNLITFGMIGVIEENKGQKEALLALKEVIKLFPNVKMIIAGGGHLDDLKTFIADLELSEYVELMGEIIDPFEAFLKMDVYLMCSKKEGLGRVTIEAMACGLPIIGYFDGGTKEILTEGVNGIFYKTDFKELAQKMLILIKDKPLRIKLGANGKSIFERNYTNDIYGKRVFSHFESLLNDNLSPR